MTCGYMQFQIKRGMTHWWKSGAVKAGLESKICAAAMIVQWLESIGSKKQFIDHDRLWWNSKVTFENIKEHSGPTR